MTNIYPGFDKDLADALDGLDRAVILGRIKLPEYWERCGSIAAWLEERGVTVDLPLERSDTTN